MKSSLYTRTGDAGSTSLVDGSRASKDSIRLESYGTIDELSSILGLTSASPELPEELKGQISDIQNLLFEIGAYLATPVAEDTDPKLLDIDVHTQRLEGWIDALDEQTPKIRFFVLPGGSQLSGRFHLARTVCRRAERRIITLANEEYVDPALVAYINRLSDYLFIAARFANFMLGIEEVAWKPRK